MFLSNNWKLSMVPGVHFWHVSMHLFHVFLSSHLPFFFSFLHFLDEILSLQSALWIDFSFSEIKTEQDKRYSKPKACNGQKIIVGQKICQWICHFLFTFHFIHWWFTWFSTSILFTNQSYWAVITVVASNCDVSN